MGVCCVHVGLEQRAFENTRALMCASQCFMHHPICKDNGTVYWLDHGNVHWLDHGTDTNANSDALCYSMLAFHAHAHCTAINALRCNHVRCAS